MGDHIKMETKKVNTRMCPQEHSHNHTHNFHCLLSYWPHHYLYADFPAQAISASILILLNHFQVLCVWHPECNAVQEVKCSDVAKVKEAETLAAVNKSKCQNWAKSCPWKSIFFHTFYGYMKRDGLFMVQMDVFIADLLMDTGHHFKPARWRRGTEW